MDEINDTQLRFINPETRKGTIVVGPECQFVGYFDENDSPTYGTIKQYFPDTNCTVFYTGGFKNNKRHGHGVLHGDDDEIIRIEGTWEGTCLIKHTRISCGCREFNSMDEAIAML